jgi:hypothetical protein
MDTITLEERKIMDDNSLNLPQKAAALEKLRDEMDKHPVQPEWVRHPEIADELRGIVLEIKRTGEVINTVSAEVEKCKTMQEEIRMKIREREIPASLPTLESALEFSNLKNLEPLLSGYLSVLSARHAVAISQTWAGVQRLSRRLTNLTGRGLWSFDDRNVHRPQNVHTICLSEVERVLRGEKDKFDLMNETPAVPNFIR